MASQKKMLKINYSDSEWVLRSEMESKPMLWYVMMDGLIVDARTLPIDLQIYCAQRGLIPYVPGLEDQ